LHGLHHRDCLHEPIIFLVSYDTSDSWFYGWCKSPLWCKLPHACYGR